MAKSKKARANEVVAILRQQYGSFKGAQGKGLTYTMLLSAIGEGRGETGAHEALESIKESFVDWNEVRVSTVGELAPILAGHGIKKTKERVRALKETIEEIYQKYNTLTVDRLEGSDAKGREKGVRRLRAADPAAVEAGLLYGFDTPIVGVSPTVQRVARRVGVLDPTAVPARMLKTLTPDVNGKAQSDVLHAYAVVAAEHCFLKDPACENCPLLAICDFGPKELEKRERARVVAEKKRKVEEDRERKLAEKQRKKRMDVVTKRLQEATERADREAARRERKRKKRKGEGDGSEPASAGKSKSATATKSDTKGKKATTRAKKSTVGKKKSTTGKSTPSTKTKKKASSTKKKTSSGKQATASKKKASTKKSATSPRKKSSTRKKATSPKKKASTRKAKKTATGKGTKSKKR